MKLWLLLLLSSFNVIFGQGNWQVQNPYPTESSLFKIEPVTDNLVYAGGYGGTLLKTTDKGNNWKVIKFKDLIDIRGISFTDSLNGFILDSEHIQQTNDGGKNWRQLNIDVDFSLYSFLDVKSFGNILYLFLKPKTAIIQELMNSHSQIFKSTDNGATWKELDISIKGELISTYFQDSSKGFLYVHETIDIGNSCDYLYKTTDGGVSWQKSIIPQISGKSKLFFINNNIGLVGQFRTSDGGQSWNNVFSKCLKWNDGIDDIYFKDSLHGWAISWFNILQTVDGGLTWKLLEQNSTSRLTSIGFSSDGTGWIVGWFGNIFLKDTVYDNWTQLKKGYSRNFNDIFFKDEKTGWCIGTSGTILHTINGGLTWETQDSHVDSTLFSLKFVNDLQGWIAGYYILLNTIDGGKNWTVRDDQKKYFSDIDFFDTENGILIERSGNVLRTTNNGKDWIAAAEKPFRGELTSIFIINKNEAWIGGVEGLIHVLNKGETLQWNALPGLSQVKKIQFTDSCNGFILNELGRLLRTTDGGLTWYEIPRGDGLKSGPIVDFYMLNKSNGYIYWEYNGHFLRHIKIEQEISVLNDDDYGVSFIHNLYFYDSNHGWAIGAGGTILNLTIDNTSSIIETKENHADSFSDKVNIAGNYIKIKLQNSSYVNVYLYNSIGQKVSTVFSGWLNSGNNSVVWKHGNLASGHYFIYLQSAEINDIKKVTHIH